MGRHKKPLHELKNPRVIRKSPLKTEKLDFKPTLKMLRKYKPLVDLCICTIMQQPSRSDNIEKKLRIILKHPKNWSRPEGWPNGRNVGLDDADYIYRSYSAELLILWCWERHLSKYCASDLYKIRRQTMGEITKMENMLDMVDVQEYDSNIEDNEGEDS